MSGCGLGLSAAFGFPTWLISTHAMYPCIVRCLMNSSRDQRYVIAGFGPRLLGLALGLQLYCYGSNRGFAPRVVVRSGSESRVVLSSTTGPFRSGSESWSWFRLWCRQELIPHREVVALESSEQALDLPVKIIKSVCCTVSKTCVAMPGGSVS